MVCSHVVGQRAGVPKMIMRAHRTGSHRDAVAPGPLARLARLAYQVAGGCGVLISVVDDGRRLVLVSVGLPAGLALRSV